jgi:hypothetical protein
VRGPHIVNVAEEGAGAGAAGSGANNTGRTGAPVVQHRDGGRVREDEAEGPSEIPPAYDSIVRD